LLDLDHGCAQKAEEHGGDGPDRCLTEIEHKVIAERTGGMLSRRDCTSNSPHQDDPLNGR
jgi:hypothetical protein